MNESEQKRQDHFLEFFPEVPTTFIDNDGTKVIVKNLGGSLTTAGYNFENRKRAALGLPPALAKIVNQKVTIEGSKKTIMLEIL